MKKLMSFLVACALAWPMTSALAQGPGSSGVLFLLISVTPVREAIAKAMPAELRIASAAGIGIFLTFIGLKNAGLIAADPVTFVKLGTLDRHTLFGAVGMLVTVLLLVRRSSLAFLAGIFVVTVITWVAGEIKVPERIVAPEERYSASVYPLPTPAPFCTSTRCPWRTRKATASGRRATRFS